jgi:hypothetical protein
MHRSGTSALTRVLSLLGAALPEHLIPSNPRNPLGFFESERIYPLHDQLLEEAGTSWDDVSPLPLDWIDSPSAAAWVKRIAEIVREEFGSSELFVVKDPRLCRLVPLWLRVLEQLEVEPRFVIPIRDPLECAASLAESSEVPTARGLLLWLQYFLAAEHDTRDHVRSFVTYTDLLSDWRVAVARIERDLELRLPRVSRGAEAEDDAFLNRTLRRQVADPQEIYQRSDVHPWVRDAYRWATATAAGKRAAPSRLDRLREELARAEAAFGPALAAAQWQQRQQRSRQNEATEELSRIREVLAREEKQLRELRADLAELGRLRETLRALFRWIVDRVRDPDQPAPGSLKATLAALEAAKPVEIPGLASTGLLIADQRLRIQELERERASRAARLAELAQRLDRAEETLAGRDERAAELTRELERSQSERRELGVELSGRGDEIRRLRAEAIRAAAEARRLERECAKLLASGPSSAAASEERKPKSRDD